MTVINQISIAQFKGTCQYMTDEHPLLCNVPLNLSIWITWITSSFLVVLPAQEEGENHANCSAILNTKKNNITFDHES